MSECEQDKWAKIWYQENSEYLTPDYKNIEVDY